MSIAAAGPHDPSVPVVVEVIALSVRAPTLRARVVRGPLPGLTPPDELARELAGGQAAGAGVVLHSTSWRHTGQQLIVTYALFPAPDSNNPAAHDLQEHLATGPGPLHPTPLLIADRHVAAHAVRHLADLAADRDPHVVACAQQRPRDWQVLRDHARNVHAHPAPAIDDPEPVDDPQPPCGATATAPDPQSCAGAVGTAVGTAASS